MVGQSSFSFVSPTDTRKEVGQCVCVGGSLSQRVDRNRAFWYVGECHLLIERRGVLEIFTLMGSPSRVK